MHLPEMAKEARMGRVEVEERNCWRADSFLTTTLRKLIVLREGKGVYDNSAESI